MTQILLVHGSCHGAWCWRDTVPALAALGLKARAIDLPSHGGDTTPIADVTLELYAARILRALSEPTLIVGHSAAGFAIAEAAARAQGREAQNIAGLVYLCAYRPAPGQSLIDMRNDAPSQPLQDALDVSADRLAFRFRPDSIEHSLYQDCPPGTAEMARALLGWQAIAPQACPVSGPVPKAIPEHYIICEADQAIPPAHQATMARDLPAGFVHRLNTGHSPFFAAPEALARCISQIHQGPPATKSP